jgi:SAM-dependent methyltransferase
MSQEQSFWEQRWKEAQTGWDLGAASPALLSYAQSRSERAAKILIPGCGSAWEAAALIDLGYTNITLLDISPSACSLIRLRMGDRPELQVLCGDFFTHEGVYDLILEQTFFCAIPRSLRDEYVRKMASLLSPNGRLAGLLFGIEFDKPGPPHGGSAEEYRMRFSAFFEILRLESCTDSVKPRQGNELFFECKTKTA